MTSVMSSSLSLSLLCSASRIDVAMEAAAPRVPGSASSGSMQALDTTIANVALP